ncbi:LysR family transcriptional regulator [Salinarimonas ramus]|uniref:LysR family transcriptional regulator n=1 Tax=Salinarimonas ramus TaxID=690164 RepID=A0A917Q7A8_9HYPH|nr:LysR family transcriptional regulator [Salinarimonas ramus]GGK26607.1 LysR family transcriptional regulator [Salinarimonas ramus]
MLETRLIRSFVHVAEELHFGRAAQRLHIAQPALSRQIAQLEERLGVVLLERTQRAVTLTAAGATFLERAYRILADIDKAADEVKRVVAGEVGQLVVGFIHSSTYGIAPQLLRRFREAYPSVRLDLYEMTIQEQVEALAERRIDVGLLRPPIADPLLDHAVLEEQDFLLAVPGSHPLGARERVSIAELSQESFILFSQRNSPLFYGRIVAMCERGGFVPRLVQNATQIHTVMGLVSANMGIAIVPSVARNLHMPDVRFLAFEEAFDPVAVGVAWRRDARSPVLAAFLELARAGAGEGELESA